MDKKTIARHITALITILIWGTTFISTKILLSDFKPIEILFFRFLLGLLVLTAVYPKRLRIKDKKQELTFAAAGLCGICLYYLLENIALTYTMASNVGVIISVAPFFTAVLSHMFLKTEEKLKAQFFIGFIFAMAGICLISFSGSEFKMNSIGDILAIASAFVWAIYSLLTRKISSYGYNTIGATRRIFTYGVLFMIPFLFIFDFNFNVQKLIKPEYALNLIYLGLGASALCFVTWNYAVKVLGAVKTSVYIYIVPVITVVTSVIVLKEKITWTAAIEIGLTLIGLFLPESTMGMKMHDVVGNDVPDSEGNSHMGIIQFPVPILKGDTEILKKLRTKLFEPGFAELTVVDFSDLAQKCKTYDEFTHKMANTSESELNYIGIAICGNKKQINKLTGNMPLLR